MRQFPHCDCRVVHHPKLDNCKFCNEASDLQDLRVAWGIAFTGHSDETVRVVDWDGKEIERTLIPCPSEWSRPVEVIHRWHGNVPFTPEVEKASEEYYTELSRGFPEPAPTSDEGSWFERWINRFFNRTEEEEEKEDDGTE